MSQALPQSDAEIRNEFSDRGNYFHLMCAVNDARGGAYQASWSRYARRVMIVLGYPAVTASWSDEQTINYAQNIVMIG
jgi:hypothetical protein